MMHVKISYPDKETEKIILRLNREEFRALEAKPVDNVPLLSQEEVFTIRRSILDVHMDESVEEYIVQLIMATRNPGKYSDKLKPLLEYGASPRASIYLDRCARALAWINDKDFVSPRDVTEIAHEILRHRIGLTFEAESMGFTSDQVIDELLNSVALP